MGSMYSMSAIKSYEPYVDDCVHLLLRQLDARMAEGQSVDLQHWMQCYAFDFIGGITVRGSPLTFSRCDADIHRCCSLAALWVSLSPEVRISTAS